MHVKGKLMTWNADDISFGVCSKGEGQTDLPSSALHKIHAEG